MLGYTPRQIAALVDLAAQRLRRESAEQLAINAMAAQGESRAINKRIKNLSR